ncbi:MAG TPA: hypothetical protein VHB72_02655 [Candidatus Saccharimonadales bacterium]|nr:hypothetical protein [Candidatus Saccharimonadales bacterium]
MARVPVFSSAELTTSTIPHIELQPYQEIEVNAQSTIGSPEDADRKFGVAGKIVAVIDVADHTFSIVDTSTDPSFAVGYILCDVQFNASDPYSKGCVGLRDGEVYSIGQYDKDIREEFAFSPYVARQQFNIARNSAGLTIINGNPTNPTLLTAQLFNVKPGEDGSTHVVEKRLKGSADYSPPDESAPYGYFKDRQVLGRNSKKINGGVYLGGGAREAIVADGDSEIIDKVYRPLHTALRLARRAVPERTVLSAVRARVAQVMPYDGDMAEMISSRYYGDQLIPLSDFIKNRAGVCRHQGLLSALLLERLIADGLLEGEPGIQRNNKPDRGGPHAWGILKHDPKPAIVIDPAQGFVGTKQEAKALGHWDYDLETDLNYI